MCFFAKHRLSSLVYYFGRIRCIVLASSKCAYKLNVSCADMTLEIIGSGMWTANSKPNGAPKTNTSVEMEAFPSLHVVFMSKDTECCAGRELLFALTHTGILSDTMANCRNYIKKLEGRRGRAITPTPHPLRHRSLRLTQSHQGRQAQHHLTRMRAASRCPNRPD